MSFSNYEHLLTLSWSTGSTERTEYLNAAIDQHKYEEDVVDGVEDRRAQGHHVWAQPREGHEDRSQCDGEYREEREAYAAEDGSCLPIDLYAVIFSLLK